MKNTSRPKGERNKNNNTKPLIYWWRLVGFEAHSKPQCWKAELAFFLITRLKKVAEGHVLRLLLIKHCHHNHTVVGLKTLKGAASKLAAKPVIMTRTWLLAARKPASISPVDCHQNVLVWQLVQEFVSKLVSGFVRLNLNYYRISFIRILSQIALPTQIWLLA